MCAFSLDIGDTYTPSLLTQISSSKLTKKVHDSAYAIKNVTATRKEILAPPQNIALGLLSRVETQKKIHFTLPDSQIVEKKEYSGLALANMRRHERGATLYGSKSMGVLARRQSAASHSRGSTPHM